MSIDAGVVKAFVQPASSKGSASKNSKVTDVKKKPEAVEFDFNPETLSLTYENRPASSGSRGKGGVQSTGEAYASLSFDAIFDNTHGPRAGEDVRNRTLILTASLDHARGEEDKSKEKQAVAPVSLEFVWGTFYFKGIVKSVRETLDFFLADGTPVRSRLSVTMEAVRDDLKILTKDPTDTSSASAPGSGAGAGGPATQGLTRAAGSPVEMTDSEVMEVFGAAAWARASAVVRASSSGTATLASPAGNPWSPDGPALGSRGAALAQAVNATPLPTPSALVTASTTLGGSVAAMGGSLAASTSLTAGSSLSVGGSISAGGSVSAIVQAPLPVLGSPPRIVAEIGAPPVTAVFGRSTRRREVQGFGRPRWEGSAEVEAGAVAEVGASASRRTSW